MLQNSKEMLFSKKAPLVRLHPQKKNGASVFLSYIREPFDPNWSVEKARGHTNAYEVVAMAQSWLDAGFRVEVSGYQDRRHALPADCAVAIDIHGNLERWAASSNFHFVKVLHATGCYWKFQNQAENERLARLKERRGVQLIARRQVPPSEAATLADHITLTGNKFTSDTFSNAGKPIVRIPLSSAYEFDWPGQRDFNSAKRRFLWMGSYGMVHKGLDLVLEAFAGMTDLELTVCGRPEKEPDFYQAYKQELTRTPNIRCRGWIDPSSAEFSQIAATHATIIYPSCSEGGGGSVIHAMHAGMLPACTKASSVDLEDFGFEIAEASVHEVRRVAYTISSSIASEVEARAHAAWEYVRLHHTRETFHRAYKQYVDSTVARLHVG